MTMTFNTEVLLSEIENAVDEWVKTCGVNRLRDQRLFMRSDIWHFLGEPKYYESKYGKIEIWPVDGE